MKRDRCTMCVSCIRVCQRSLKARDTSRVELIVLHAKQHKNKEKWIFYYEKVNKIYITSRDALYSVYVLA